MPYKDREKKREYQRLRVAARRAAYVLQRGGICVCCSSPYNLEFHHRDRATKQDHKIWSWSKPRIEAELLKCDLLCSECHKIETAKERSYGTAAHGTLTSYKNYGCRCEDCRNANAQYEHERRQTHVIQVGDDAIGLGGQCPDISTNILVSPV